MLSLLNIIQNAKQQRIIRYSGMCNVATVEILKHLDAAVPGSIQIVQNPLHSPWDPEYKILQYCREKGIQYNTFHTLTSSDRIVQEDVVRFIAAERGISPQLVFLQFCVQSDITPLVGARSSNNLLSVLPIAEGTSQNLSQDEMRAISRLFAEQTVINRYRSTKLLARRQKELKREKGREKMRADQGKQMQESIAAREKREQQVVEQAKIRAKEIAEQLKAEVAAGAARKKAADEALRDRVRDFSKEEEVNEKIEEPTAVKPVTAPVHAVDDGLPTLNGGKSKSKKDNEETKS